jgi:hypothetical protein
VQYASGYVLEVALTANGQYVEVYRGLSSNYTQTGLPASSPRYGRWKVLGTGSYSDSPYSAVASATTQPVVAPGTRVYGEIPYNMEWAFADDVSNQTLSGFGDGILNQNVELNGGGGPTQPDSVVVFRFPQQMGVELTEVRLGDGQHESTTGGIPCWIIDPVTKQRIEVFRFTGLVGNGVYDIKTLDAPKRTDNFLFKWGYPMPTEVKFFGWYTPYTPAPYVPEPKNMDMMAGYVSYIYDFCLPSAQGPDGIKLELSACGKFWRLYIDTGLVYNPATGKVSFSPCRNGAWDIDGVLDRLCRVLGMRVMVCLKGNEGATWYPMVCQQFAIRYGLNDNVPDSLVNVDLTPGYGPTPNVVKKGLGKTYLYPISLQRGNEPWRWWTGDADIENQQNLQGNMTPRETLVYHKLSYDLIKAVDPTMETVTAGMPSDKPGILQGMLFWADILYNGAPFTDAVAYHKYINANGGQNLGGSPIGIQPEANNTLYEGELHFGRVIQQWSPNKPLKKYITEIGWSHANNPGSNPEQTAQPTATKDTFRRQADFVLRAGTEAAMGGSDGKAGYQWFDDPNYLDNLDGYTNWDTSNGEAGQSPSGEVFLLPAADATQQRQALIPSYFMVSSDRSDPEVRIHRFAQTANGVPNVVSVHTTAYGDATKVIQLPVPAGKTATLRTINFGVMSKAFAYVRPSVPIVTSNDGKRTAKATHPEFAPSQLEYMVNWSYQWQPYNGETLTANSMGDTFQFRVKRLNPGRNVSFIAGSPSFTANPGVTADVVSVAPIKSYDVFYDRYTPGTRVMDSQPLTITNGTVTVTASGTQAFVVFTPAT